MLEEEDFKFTPKPERSLRDKIDNFFNWLTMNILRANLKPKQDKPKIDDMRISGNSYGDDEIKVKPYGRQYGNYHGTLEEQFGRKEED